MRLNALDIFRGLTIALMILVNMAGVADHCYGALDHAPWTGWTPTDLVFPFFLFAIGMAIAVSAKADQPTSRLMSRVMKRSAILFLLGLLGNAFMDNAPGSLRVMGVLQRISLCYLAVSLAAVALSPRAQRACCAAILAGYWLAMTRFPVPGFGAGMLTREGSLATYLDRLLIGAPHLYYGGGWKGLGDPEGLFSTLPAIASTMFGYFAGSHVRGRKPDSRVSLELIVAGLAAVTLGTVWGWEFPIIKKVWTSSFALFTGGLAFMSFGVCYEFSEVRGGRRWLKPFEQFGRNSLAAFIGSLALMELLLKLRVHEDGGKAITLFNWVVRRHFEPWLGPYNGPAAFAALTVVFWWAVLRSMDRRGWHLKA